LDGGYGTIIHVNPYGQKVYFYVVWPRIQWFYRWLAQPCLIGGLNYGIAIGVDHQGFKSGRTTNDDGMRHIGATALYYKSLKNSTNPTKQGFKDLDRPHGVHYDMFLNYHVFICVCVCVCITSTYFITDDDIAY
jgi:hypothetical protein